ncbi:hypothetical protein C7N43_21890 [Sphingobacteriales bacterium UPWRP_1]|nr:hypothetical protein BVG80_16305 [Sphingobacteriales bacterium TSM_CSM]PSJ74882.1 hypothetical protein C7N43_21890 [Sphingobacteriales bacterium UPWRP_1]
MRIKITVAVLPLLVVAVMSGCTGNPDDGKTNKTEPASTAVDSGKSGSDNTAAQPAATSSGIPELLQGKWQHIDDKSNYLVFEGNHRKETAADSGKWDDETFVLSDKCSNASDKDNGAAPEKDRYISCEKSDLCWYIIEVDKSILSLSYMGRGNTLTYKRVN